MSIRAPFSRAAAGALLFLSACGGEESGPVSVTAIGPAAEVANPNLVALAAPSAFLLESVAQGLVRFDAAGEIEPALAQRWIVSDDGLRYTFRLSRTEWANGGPVTAQQVALRLRTAIASTASRNPLKPFLGFVADIQPMTDEVLEITLRAPRANFLQLLAAPEMAILQGGNGTGPYSAAPGPDGSLFLEIPVSDEEEEAADAAARPVALRSARAAAGIALFAAGGTDLLLGGTAGELPLLRAARIPAAAVQHDPVGGLFGLAFVRDEGLGADPAMRRALAMAVGRDAIVAALAVPGLLARNTILPAGLEESPQPAAPDWAALPLPARRALAARIVGAAGTGADEAPVPKSVRVAMPEGPGYRLIFAYLRRDWRIIGVEAESVAWDAADADIRFIDEVAPATMASWYLRHFTCGGRRLCDPAAQVALDAARAAASEMERRVQLAAADRLITDASLFVPIGPPVRWSLVSERVTGFRRNIFGRHPAAELIAAEN